MKILNNSLRRMPQRVKTAIKIINLYILEIIVQNNGIVPLHVIEKLTGLNSISPYLVGDLIKMLVTTKLVTINDNIVNGDMEQLTKIIEQEKTHLPDNHGKPWSEDDIVQLSELKLQHQVNAIIAKKMDRTEQSVAMQATMIRKAYKLIPIIKRHKPVEVFASDFKSPNAAR